jgi:transcriptional regulator with XRE-family HTH domain
MFVVCSPGTRRCFGVELSGLPQDPGGASKQRGWRTTRRMNINAALIKRLRLEKSWSQEELALAAGLNLRTVQRIENEATASLQSRKALAGAFGVEVRELEHVEPPVMQKYEYKTLDIEWKQGFLAGMRSPGLPELKPILDKEGEQGWRLVQVLSPDLLMSTKRVEKLLAIFERPRRDPG